MFHRFVVCFAITLATSTAHAADVCKIAVMDLDPQGLPESQAHVPKALSEALAITVAEASGCDVMTRADIATIAGFEADRQACGAASDSCLAEIGSALGVERIVAGSVVRLGMTTTVTARLLNLKSGKVDARVEDSALHEGELRPMTLKLGRALFQADRPLTPGTTSSAPEASGPPVVLIAGAVVAGIGVVAAAGGTLLAVPADGVLGDAKAPTAAKDDARTTGTIGVVVAAVGVVGIVIGGIVAAAGMVME